MTALDTGLEIMEPVGQGRIRMGMLTPVLAGSIICGVTWGVLGLQYVKWMARSGKGRSAWTMTFAAYLMILSTAYLCLFCAFLKSSFACNFGYFATAFDMTYVSWLFLVSAVCIHAPCQLFYANTACRLWGDSRVLRLILLTLIAGGVGVGIALKVILHDLAVNFTEAQGVLIRIWIALSTGTNLLLTVTLSLAFLEGACKRITGTSSGVRIPPFFAGSQFLATSVSLGLGLIVFANPESPAVHLWLGLPLVYPINVLSTLGWKQSARADLEAEAEKASGGLFTPSYNDEKRSNGQDGRRSVFPLSPFSADDSRRMPNRVPRYIAPIVVPAASGVRRVSQLFNVLPPLRKVAIPVEEKSVKLSRKRADSGRSSALERYPSSLDFPLQAEAIPSGESELVPRAKALERTHSLAQLDLAPSLSAIAGETASPPLSPASVFSSLSGHLNNTLARVSSRSGQHRSPPPTPNPIGAIQAHEAFELPNTPLGGSPEIRHSELPETSQCASVAPHLTGTTETRLGRDA